MNDATKAAQPLLPFTRPTIDEETIAAVAEVLRSGWLASGPKVAQLEAELSRYCGGRPVRSQTSATAGLEMALLACGIGPGDEVITPGAELRRDRQRHHARRRAAGVRRRRASIRATSISSRWRRPSPRARAPSCRCTSPACPWTWSASTPSPADTSCGSSKTPRTPSAPSWQRAAHRQLRGPGVLQLPSEQEHDDHRGRRHLGRLARGS